MRPVLQSERPRRGALPGCRLPVFATAVLGLDASLRRWYGIREYSTSPDCILRIARAEAKHTIVLSDETTVLRGASVLELHLWNERLPIFDGREPSFRGACRLARQFEFSLRELARYILRDPQWSELPVIHAELPFGTAERAGQLLHIMLRFGFEPDRTAPRPGLFDRLHRFGHNILVALLLAARNPGALRSDVLRRDRVDVYISRRDLLRRYG
jgi:hypothetical protein